MSVLIKGAKLPKSCFGCHLFKLDDRDLWCIANHYAGCCRVLSKYIDENKFVTERHPDCPLIEVPAQPERTCLNCGRTANNGGWYADGSTRCQIEEHYALPKNGYCHLWEKRNVTDDDYPERRTDE